MAVPFGYNRPRFDGYLVKCQIVVPFEEHFKLGGGYEVCLNHRFNSRRFGMLHRETLHF